MNQITTQAWYNWHFENALLDTNASYERWYLQVNTTQQNLTQTLKDIDLFSFEESAASRLVINFNWEINDIKNIQNLCEQKGLEISSHQEFDNQIHHLYIEKNKQEREVPVDVQMSILW
jgi:hypothetical protein